MPRIDDVLTAGPDLLEVPGIEWIHKMIQPGFARGGVYLMTGEPGVGKSTLALQVAGDLAINGVQVLYLTTEQGLSDLKRAIQRIHGTCDGFLPESIRNNLYLDDTVEDVEDLPRFLARKVLAETAEYHGVQAIVLDSIQGRGLSPAATKKYRSLYEFAETAKAHGLVTLLLGHVTKRGQIAGPKNLEHNVDVVLYFRRAFRLRPLFVPKNRFGPAMLDPLVLMMDGLGRLVESPHSAGRSTTVLGYGGRGDNLAEGQAVVSLPRYGCRAQLNSPFLPGKKVKQLLGVLSTLKDVDLTDLSYQISCYLPGPQRYCQELDLTIAVALLASYLQQPVPEGTLFCGELDLSRRVRAPESPYLKALGQAITGPQLGRVNRVYLANDVAQELARMRPDPNGPPVMEVADVRGIGDLEELLGELWPSATLGGPGH